MKSLKVKEVKLADAIKASNNALGSTKDQIERAHEMISKANLLLSRAEPVRVVGTAQLEQLIVESNQVHQLEEEEEAALAEIRSATFNQEELNSQDLAKAKKNKRSKLSALEETQIIRETSLI